jgi:hypothetical protein
VTRDDVLAMKPGPEMDAAVATLVMGHPGAFHDYVFINGRRCDVRTWIPKGWTPEEAPAGMFAGAGPRRYSAEIGLAWEVVERFEHGPIVSHPPQGHDWDWPVEIVRIADGERYSGWSVCLGGSTEVVSPSITEAICKAALLTTVKA